MNRRTKSFQPSDRDSLDHFLTSGRDIRFRDFIADLFAVAGGMQSIRRAVARRSGVSSTGLAILLAVWRLGRDEPVGIRRVADNLHVAAANITSEVTYLISRELMSKEPNPEDHRAVHLALTEHGLKFLEALDPCCTRSTKCCSRRFPQMNSQRLQDYLERVLKQMGW